MQKTCIAVDLYSAADHFLLHFFLSLGVSLGFYFLVILVGLWALLVIGHSSSWAFGPCFLLGVPPHELLGTNLQKRASITVLYTT